MRAWAERVVHACAVVIAIASGALWIDAAPAAATVQPQPVGVAERSTTPSTSERPREWEAPREDPRGKAYTFRVRSALDPGHGLPNAWVYVPKAFDPTRRELHVAVIFHGWQNCIRSYVSPHGDVCSQRRHTGYDIPAQAEESGTRAIVVVPQLAYEVKSSESGPLGEPGGLRRFLVELVEEALAPVLGPHRYDDVSRVALLASSGGWQALTPALVRGGVDDRVRDVYLLDALYDAEPLTSWFLARRRAFDPDGDRPMRFALVYCWFISGSARVDESFGETMRGALEEEGLAGVARIRTGPAERREPTDDELAAPFVVVQTGMDHDAMVRTYLWRVLRAASL